MPWEFPMTQPRSSRSPANSATVGNLSLVIPRSLRHWALVILLLLGSLPTTPLNAAQPPAGEPARWWKGNLHTHSFWSDGDDFPESILDYYKTNGYHFVSLSDHNVMQTHERWVTVTNGVRKVAFEKYLQRFGEKWVEVRSQQSATMARLKTLDEFGKLFNERSRFLVIPAEEITARYKLQPIHINATNLRDELKPQEGTNVVDVIQRNLDAIREQRRRTGQPILPHINHPNFGWAMTGEELMQVRGETFFEVYNGHPSVHNEGDEHYASLERMWDISLAFRLSQLKLGLLYGLAVDDSHHYHHFARTNSNPGRGWVMVRSSRLDAASLIAAMEAGDFYATSGVRLKDVRRTKRELAVEIEAEPGVSYKTEFIGTLKGFDPTSRPGPRPTNSIYAVTRLYTEQIGAVLAVAEGPRASYTLDGDELYVRAKVTSTKPKLNAFGTNETEVAWTQPVVPAR